MQCLEMVIYYKLDKIILLSNVFIIITLKFWAIE